MNAVKTIKKRRSAFFSRKGALKMFRVRAEGAFAQIPPIQKAALLAMAVFYLFAASQGALRKIAFCALALAAPIFFAAKKTLAAFALLAVFFASFSLLQGERLFFCGISDENLAGIEGKIVSNPAKAPAQNYLCRVELSKAFGKNLAADAGGKIEVLIPAAIVEANWREKIHSKSKKLRRRNRGFSRRNRLERAVFGKI